MSTVASLRRGRSGARSIQAAIEDLAELPIHTVANKPDAAENVGRLIYVSNGAAGSACLAYSNGTNWLRVLLGAAVSAT